MTAAARDSCSGSISLLSRRRFSRRSHPVLPLTPGKTVKTPDAKEAWCCTMALHRPAAERDEAIRELSV